MLFGMDSWANNFPSNMKEKWRVEFIPIIMQNGKSLTKRVKKNGIIIRKNKKLESN